MAKIIRLSDAPKAAIALNPVSEPVVQTIDAPLEAPAVHPPEHIAPLKPVSTDQEAEARASLRFYRAKGFIITIDGENSLSIDRDDGSHPDALRWANGGVIRLRIGQTTAVVMPVMTSEEASETEAEPAAPEMEAVVAPVEMAVGSEGKEVS